MNNESLIDETELRQAMRLSPIDRDAFNQGVRQRVLGVGEQQRDAMGENVTDRNVEPPTGYLRVAASILPLHLLGGGSSVPSLAAVGLAKKLIGYLALPMACFAMVIVTLMGMRKIRAAQRSGEATDVDLLRWHAACKGWWRQYGWIAAAMFVFALLAPFAGWTTPLLIILVGSGAAMVSLIVLLAKSEMVTRPLIASICLPMLGLLSQVAMMYAIIASRHLLDPHLVMATLLLGMTILICLTDVPAAVKDCFVSSRLARGVWISLTLIFLGGFTAVMGQTLWRPFGVSATVRFVESFPNRRHPDWRAFLLAAQWLEEEGIQSDLSKPREKIQERLASEKTTGTYVNHAATLLGIVPAEELMGTEFTQGSVDQWLDERQRHAPILSIDIQRPIFEMLVADPALTDQQRDRIRSRLVATWDSLSKRESGYALITDAAILTECFAMLNPDENFQRRSDDVARWLDESQVRDVFVFSPSGGFQSSRRSNVSDEYATARAVQLMQVYGIPDSIDQLALRTSLRPSWHDHWMNSRATVRFITRTRLERVAGVRPVTLADYVRTERALCFAILLVAMCVVAMLGTPKHTG